MLQARRLSTYRSCPSTDGLAAASRRSRFYLARSLDRQLLSDRAMQFWVRQTAAAFSAAALIFCCSCEKHHLGEDPEVQREHVVVPGESDETSGATKETSTSPSATASPT